MADTLDGLIAQMPTDARRSRPDPQRRYSEAFTPPSDGAVIPTSHGDRPFSGPSSPWGVDLEVRRDGEEAVATTTLDAAHEGAPGRSHGGIVAGVFDDVFGFLLPIHQVAAFTGELTVRYLAPTPLHVPLEFRVRLDRREGRKLVMSGEGTAGDLCFARATAVFISPNEAPTEA